MHEKDKKMSLGGAFPMRKNFRDQIWDMQEITGQKKR